MDEVGFMVSGITPKGMIKLLPIGGMNPDVYLSQNMHIVINKEKTIKGIIGAMPPHLTKGEKKPLTFDDLLLDIGADSKEDAIKMGVKIGQQIVSENEIYYIEVRNLQESGLLFLEEKVSQLMKIYLLYSCQLI